MSQQLHYLKNLAIMPKKLIEVRRFRPFVYGAEQTPLYPASKLNAL